MKNLTRSEVAEILLAHDNYAIVTHRRPDGDTLGSSALLCMGLRQLGKNAHILANHEITPKYVHLHQGLTKPVAEEGDFVVTVDVASENMLPDCFKGLPFDLRIDHHGSATSTSPSFLAAVEPQYAVISYKTGNSYGHPTFQTLQRLLDQGVTVYGTGQSGTILLTSDGYNCTFSTSLTLSLEHAGNQ